MCAFILTFSYTHHTCSVVQLPLGGFHADYKLLQMARPLSLENGQPLTNKTLHDTLLIKGPLQFNHSLIEVSFCTVQAILSGYIVKKNTPSLSQKTLLFIKHEVENQFLLMNIWLVIRGKKAEIIRGKKPACILYSLFLFFLNYYFVQTWLLQ